LNHENINHLNRSTTCNEIEAAIQGLSKKMGPGSDIFTADFLQTFKEELIPTLFLKNSHKTERERTMSNSFYETHITLIPKPDKDTTKRITCQPI
jgi:hypothetical protein